MTASAPVPGGRARLGRLLPLLLVVGVVPLIVRLEVIPLSGIRFDAWTGAREDGDLFTYVKSVWAVLLAVLAGLNAWYQGGRLPGRFVLPLAGMAVWIVLSAVFSRHPALVWYGAVTRSEGLPVLLGYLVLTVSAACLVRGEADLAWLRRATLGGSMVIAIWGLFQLFHDDPIRWDWVKTWVVPEHFAAYRSLIQTTGSADNVYASLLNSNYVGSYLALILFLPMIHWFFGQPRGSAGTLGVTTILLVILFGCRSRTGLLAVGLVTLMFLLKAARGRKADWWMRGAVLVGLAMGIALTMHFFMLLNPVSNPLLNRLSMGDERRPAVRPAGFCDLELATDSAKVFFEDFSFGFVWEKDEVRFVGVSGEPLSESRRGDRVLFLGGAPQDLEVFASQSMRLVQVRREALEINVVKTPAGMKILNHRHVPVDYPGKEVPIFPKGWDRWGNGRGYIWSRSLPLVWKALWVGFGPENYVAYFPHHDFRSRWQAGYATQLFIDKPHNLYIQMAINTGMPSLVFFLLLVGRYLRDSFRAYWNSPLESDLEKTGMGIACGILGYLLTGLGNDSTVCAAPVFWVLLGAGIAANERVLAWGASAEDVGARRWD